MQTFNFSALGREINAAGTYVRYERETTGAADASIRVRVNGNDLGLWLPGDYVSLPEAFARVEIIPIAGAVGEVRIGNGLFSSSRIVMQGTVSIEDLAKTTTEASKAGMGHVLAAQSLGNTWPIPALLASVVVLARSSMLTCPAMRELEKHMPMRTSPGAGNRDDFDAGKGRAATRNHPGNRGPRSLPLTRTRIDASAAPVVSAHSARRVPAALTPGHRHPLS